MSFNSSRSLLLVTAYQPKEDRQNAEDDLMDAIFQRINGHASFSSNVANAKAILEDLRTNRQHADRNMLSQFVIDLLRKDTPNTAELSPLYSHLLYSLVQDLLRPDLGENIRKQLPYCMLHQLHELLLQYKSQTSITQEMFANQYLHIQHDRSTSIGNRHFHAEFPVVMWLNHAIEVNRLVDEPRSCLRRAYTYRQLTSIRWNLLGFIDHTEIFLDAKRCRKMLSEDGMFRELTLDNPITMRDGNVVMTLGELIDYLIASQLDRRVQIRVSPLRALNDYRFELLFLNLFNEMKGQL